jgi:hypothetical protein
MIVASSWLSTLFVQKFLLIMNGLNVTIAVSGGILLMCDELWGWREGC